MTLYRSRMDKKLYVLSTNHPMKMTGSWLEYMSWEKYRTGDRTSWKEVPRYRNGDFVAVALI